MTVLIEKRTNVLSLTLNRPQVLNSFNAEMAYALQAALSQAASDLTIRAVLLSATGRAFCAGQDLSEVAPREDGSLPDLGEILLKHYNPIIVALRELEKPIVCAVNGIAAGAGANLALAADIVVAAESASFVQSFAHVGLIPDSGGTYILPRLVGLARATAWSMLAEKVSAQDAEKFGLIYKAIPDADLASEANKLAQRLASMPTRGLALTKRAFQSSFQSDLEAQLALEADLQCQLGKSKDYLEGVTAFLAKRKPDFKGN